MTVTYFYGSCVLCCNNVVLAFGRHNILATMTPSYLTLQLITWIDSFPNKKFRYAVELAEICNMSFAVLLKSLIYSCWILGSLKQGKPWILRLLVISCLSLAAKMKNAHFSVSDFQVTNHRISTFIISWKKCNTKLAMETYVHSLFKQWNRERKLVSSLTHKPLIAWNFSFLMPWIGEWDRLHLSPLCISLFLYLNSKIHHPHNLSKTELQRLFSRHKMVTHCTHKLLCNYF